MRGEYASAIAPTPMPVELPPRARRIRQVSVGGVECDGTTSACAENTRDSHGSFPNPRNYLRVRGEYHYAGQTISISKELPPRARRIPEVLVTDVVTDGTTSACAENTIATERLFYDFWNYLRVRGEYFSTGHTKQCLLELPPRARRIRISFNISGGFRGTTSACAENTGFIQ